jgi:lipid-binding SYLF domain-containing protein
MKLRTVFALFATLVTLGTAGAYAATDKMGKQAEISKATAASLEKFYKAEPRIKGEVAAAPGYAVFTSYGFSFVFGGAGGPGIAHDKATQKTTYMSMAQASAGMQAGATKNDVLLVFKTPKALKEFIDTGWEVGAGGTVSAGAGGKSTGGGIGDQFVDKAVYYTLTSKGLEVGVAIAGTKFWKDKELN